MEQQQQYNKELFQFHNGTINTTTEYSNYKLFHGFNSTTVQLIPIKRTKNDYETHVSIPQRYN